jgi:tetratricopeptide (TPR) repeat protein
LFLCLSAAAVLYAFLAGLRTVTDYDLFWQMATGRWVAQHHAIFSTDIFSYTAQGQPWIYPVGSGLFFYAAFLCGGYKLISGLGALACVGTVVLLLRRGSAATAALAIIAVPALAARTAPRADLFTVVLFASFLTILWERYENGTGPLWLLPLLMVAWVNLHLGFLAGLALVGAYAAVEAFRLLVSQQRPQDWQRFKTEFPWLGATFAATLMNPWGWGVYQALFRQEAAMAVHYERITEWAGLSITSQTFRQALSLRDPASSGEWLMLAALIAVIISLWQRNWFAAVLLAVALVIGMRHFRFLALFACCVVVVGGSVMTSAFNALRCRVQDERLCSIVGAGAAAALILLAGVRSMDLASNRYYFTSFNEISSFGTGLSWWYPANAMAFVERENLPPQILNTYEEGGFLLWSLGPKYRDYVDGRAIPFGPEMFSHLQVVLQSSPDSEVWKRETATLGINTVVFPLGRYYGLKYVGSVLPAYCNSTDWRPVYLDEVSAVFVRRLPETEALIERNSVDCYTAPIPSNAASADRADDFNRWANAAAVLLTLNRNQEAVNASRRALQEFSDSASLWYVRGKALLLMNNPNEAEKALLQSAALDTSVAAWSELANLYRAQRRLPAAIDALERLSGISPDPPSVLVVLGFTYLDASNPQKAIGAFDRAEKSLPAGAENQALAAADHGRASAWATSGDLRRAVDFEEKAIRIAPENANYWSQLARLYGLQGRKAEAESAAERADALASGH